MKIAVEGCAHGELNKIYETICYIETQKNIKIDLLICCGDFQSVRDEEDMQSMAVPAKFMHMKDFHEYYTGTKKAPVLTLFIGGNHEAARYLWELPYGGWVAENIYYLGYAGVVNFCGYRIGGLSGIYKPNDYYKGHFERPPFNESTKRSFYHIRSVDVAKAKLLSDKPIDVFLSHDWPKNIYHYGDCEQLLRFKPYFKQEIEKSELGSDAAEDVLKTLKPTYWFSGHLHAKFSALFQHEDGLVTKFLALDKCLPKRNFLQVIELGPAKQEAVLKYDLDWLAVLRATDEIKSSSCKQTFLCELDDKFKPNEERLQDVLKLCDNLNVIEFWRSQNGVNKQTVAFCERFKLSNPCESSYVIVNNAFGGSRRSFNSISSPKPNNSLSLPKPKCPQILNNEIEADKTDLKKTTKLISNDDDDFNELVRPSAPADEISDDETSASSSDSDEDVEHLSEFSKTPSKFNQSFSSFIQTPCKSNFEDIESPFKSKFKCVNVRSSVDGEVSSPSTIKGKLPNLLSPTNIDSPALSPLIEVHPELEKDAKTELMQTPVAKKKFKLVRRNQEIYSANNED